jgi:hypothetical protein
MSASPKPKPPPPKLFTKRKLLLPVIAIFSGAALLVVREYRLQGRVSGLTLGASAAALLIGLIIVAVLGRYANKPER